MNSLAEPFSAGRQPPNAIADRIAHRTPTITMSRSSSNRMTPDYYDSGGGFGNTIRLQDGSLLTPYSFLDADPEIHELVRTGAFMEQATLV